VRIDSDHVIIDTLVKHFASMLGARGIRVNAVAPGVVETDMSKFTKTAAGRDLALGTQAPKRLARPDDIGGVIAFLASDNARLITGAKANAARDPYREPACWAGLAT
jgi:3-oxoacyl-[acyl-carrier protein] reductase